MGDENLNSSKKCDTNKCNVLIIGAGMAGLSAANYLLKMACKTLKFWRRENGSVDE